MSDDNMMTIKQFIEYAGISKSTYYKMRSLGQGPKETIVPGTRIIRITADACRAWERQPPGAVVQRQRQQRAEAARRARQCARSKTQGKV